MLGTSRQHTSWFVEGSSLLLCICMLCLSLSIYIYIYISPSVSLTLDSIGASPCTYNFQWTLHTQTHSMSMILATLPWPSQPSQLSNPHSTLLWASWATHWDGISLLGYSVLCCSSYIKSLVALLHACCCNGAQYHCSISCLQMLPMPKPFYGKVCLSKPKDGILLSVKNWKLSELIMGDLFIPFKTLPFHSEDVTAWWWQSFILIWSLLCLSGSWFLCVSLSVVLATSYRLDMRSYVRGAGDPSRLAESITSWDPCMIQIDSHLGSRKALEHLRILRSLHEADWLTSWLKLLSTWGLSDPCMSQADSQLGSSQTREHTQRLTHTLAEAMLLSTLRTCWEIARSLLCVKFAHSCTHHNRWHQHGGADFAEASWQTHER